MTVRISSTEHPFAPQLSVACGWRGGYSPRPRYRGSSESQPGFHVQTHEELLAYARRYAHLLLRQLP
jgi:hypothetical protein